MAAGLPRYALPTSNEVGTPGCRRARHRRRQDEWTGPELPLRHVPFQTLSGDGGTDLQRHEDVAPDVPGGTRSGTWCRPAGPLPFPGAGETNTDVYHDLQYGAADACHILGPSQRNNA